MTQAVLDIEGMSCGHCLNAVNRALSALAGVEVAAVQMGRAEVRFDEHITDTARLTAAVGEAGYKASVRQ